MRNGIATAVTLALFFGFLYVGYYAGFWETMTRWSWKDWMVCIFWALTSWLARNEFGNGGR